MKSAVRQEFRPNTAGIVFCVAVAASLLLQVVLFAALPHDTAQWCYTFAAPVLYIVATFVGGLFDGTDVPRALGLTRAPRLWQMGLAAALALACIFAFLPLAEGVSFLFDKMGYHGGPNYVDYTSSWGNMLLGLVVLALMPALGEETLCRGAVFGALKQKGTYFGIVLSALLFALWHGSPVQLVHQFLIGIVMAVLVHLTRTVWVSVLFHFCNNAAVVLYEFAYTQAGWSYTIPWWVYLIMFVVGSAIVSVLLVAYARLTLRSAPPQEGALTSDDDRPTARLRRLADVHGEYTPYVKGQAMWGMYAAFAVVGVLWIINTVSGWMA